MVSTTGNCGRFGGLDAVTMLRVIGVLLVAQASVLSADAPVPAATAEIVPASSVQATRLIDLTKFSRMEGAKILVDQPFMLMYAVDGKADDALAFNRQALLAAGWTEQTPADAQGTLTLTQQGFELQVSAYDDGQGHLNVSLTNIGNFDVRRLPRPQGSKLVYEGFVTAICECTGSITDVEVFCFKELRKHGWHAASRMDAAGAEDGDTRGLSFIMNGIEVVAFISRSADAPGQCSLQYSASLLPLSFPAPDDADWVELSLGRDQAVYVTRGTVEQTADFLQKGMPVHGWEPTDRGGEQFLVFSRDDGFLGVKLTELEQGTRVEFGDGLAGMSWHLRSAGSADSEAAADNGAQDNPTGVEAADIPLRADASEIRRDRDQQQVSFHTKENVSSNIKFYSGLITKWGFKLEGPGVEADDFALKNFKQGEREIAFRCGLHGPGVYRVSLSGDGILWTRPVESDELAVSYETWLRRKGLGPGLEHLDAFAKEMAGKK